MEILILINGLLLSEKVFVSILEDLILKQVTYFLFILLVISEGTDILIKDEKAGFDNTYARSCDEDGLRSARPRSQHVYV